MNKDNNTSIPDAEPVYLSTFLDTSIPSCGDPIFQDLPSPPPSALDWLFGADVNETYKLL